MKNPINVKRGKRARASGRHFEIRVRKDLEEKGWIVDKFGNNVSFDSRFTDSISMKMTGNILLQGTGKLIQAKNKWAGPGRPMMMGAGFPDFLCFRGINIKKYLLELSNQMCKENIGIQNLRRTASFKSLNEIKNATLPTHEVIGVEVKSNGYLDKVEKEKCQWYLDNQIFSKILIVSKYKEKNRVKIKYEDFLEKYG